MDEAKDIVESLRLAQAQIAGRRDPVNAFNRIEVAIELIQRLAAEVELLRPREMSLRDAIGVLNEHAYGDGRWRLDKQYKLFAEDPYGRRLTTYDAIAVAEKLMREKEPTT